MTICMSGPGSKLDLRFPSLLARVPGQVLSLNQVRIETPTSVFITRYDLGL